MEMDNDIEKELRTYEQEKKLTQLGLENTKNEFAHLLTSGLGQDIKDTLEGKRIVKIGKRETFKRKVQMFFHNFFNCFS